MTYYIFFFQAEDGIRDGRVTGVQTCALPISSVVHRRDDYGRRRWTTLGRRVVSHPRRLSGDSAPRCPQRGRRARSEERRVGKESRSRWSSYYYKKKKRIY